MKTQPEARGLGKQKPLIFQLVGYSNSGKTTFMTKLVECLSLENKKVVTLKHHGHGGQPEVIAKKDSSQHINAGALASLVEGEGRIVLQSDRLAWPLSEQLELLSFFQPDFIFIEGYKNEDYPKVILVKNSEDCELLDTLTNLVAVFYWDEAYETLLRRNNELPLFHLSDQAGLKWLMDYLINKQSNC
ncbi:molybdopterin-guanine dinucleotide biosynthesis protein B [Bacillus sp. T3]|uniref:molybdopterin-guanine dinucleotide biosynthesis protein B n=1 Tax=Bacillus sp. T3 TaxID=467262 RepID=UPI0029815FFD|nr:molybdopterin-guanine dinucleotide biosynthesis protein B [Bacillus sp. T3]